MIGNVALESHPYYQKFVYQLRSRIQYWASQGAITPQELQLMCIMAQNPGQQTIGFIQSLGVRYPNGIDEAHMQSEIDETFLPALRQAARQKIAMGTMGSATLQGMGLNGLNGLGMNKVEPMAAFSTGRSMAAGLFGEMKVQPTIDAKKAEQPKPAEQTTTKLPDPVKPWKCPEFDDNFQTSKFTICNCANILFGKFNLHDGKTCLRMLINDPRIRYTSDEDVIGTYRPYIQTFRNDHKFITIQYKQLMAIPVGREEMMKLANEVALTISKMENNLCDRLKSVVQITRGTRFSFACSEAYNKLFCDEFDLHMQCGELTLSSNPKMVLNRFSTIQDILNFVSKDIDKSTVQALEKIPDYYKTLNRIVEDIVYDIALNFTKKIVNPNKHLSVLGSYMRALPPVWSTDTDLSMRGTEDLMELWVMSNVQVSGSKSDGAIAAGSSLKSKIEELDKQFTVFWLWRQTTWTDYPASSAVAYDAKGECHPTTWDLNNPKSDVTFFIGELMKATEEGSDAQMKRAPHSIYMDYEESKYSLNYGWTVDARLWLGCPRYWK